MPISGMQHVAHNLLHEVHNALPGWTDFYQQLANFNAFLCRKDRVDRFQWTCVRHDPFSGELAAGMAGIKHTCHKLYDKRWHVVVSCVQKAIPAYTLVAAAWDQVKFAGCVDSVGVKFCQCCS